MNSSMKTPSPLLLKLLRNENIHNIAVDNMNLNDDNEIIQNLQKKTIIPDFQQNYRSFEIFENNNNYEDLSKKNKFRDLNEAFLSVYRLHSSKFHSRKEENSKSLNQKIKEEIDMLIKEKNNRTKMMIMNNSNINKSIKNKSIYKNINELKKKVAFRYRYIDNSPKKINLRKNFKLKDEKMNKILNISKSIPTILLKENNSVINENKNKVNDNKEENNKNNYRNKQYGFTSPFKLNRYIGNMYDYYKSKSSNSINDNNILILNEEKNNNNSNHINLDEKMNNININYNEGNNIFSSIINNNDNNQGINNNERKKKIRINKKTRTLKLNSLL